MSGDWRRIELSRDAVRAGELEIIRAQFALYCMAGDTAADVAIFTRRNKAGGSDLYFSPAALRYAEFVFERHPPCASGQPALLGSTLLVGNHDAVAALLGKSSGVQSFRKQTEQKSELSVRFLHSPAPAVNR